MNIIVKGKSIDVVMRRANILTFFSKLSRGPGGGVGVGRGIAKWILTMCRLSLMY
jgi:hypothetical protein